MVLTGTVNTPTQFSVQLKKNVVTLKINILLRTEFLCSHIKQYSIAVSDFFRDFGIIENVDRYNTHYCWWKNNISSVNKKAWGWHQTIRIVGGATSSKVCPKRLEAYDAWSYESRCRI